MLVSKPVTEWLYFSAGPDSAAAKALDKAETELAALAAAVNSLRARYELIAFSRGPQYDRLDEIGISATSDPGEGWVKVQEGVYRADPHNAFYTAQKELLARYNKVLNPSGRGPFYDPDNPVYIVGKGTGESDPQLGILSYRERISVSRGLGRGSDTLPRREVTHLTEARRWKSTWLFKVPVNPDDGCYFHPPGARELSEQELGGTGAYSRFAANFEKQPLFEAPPSRVFGKIGLYYNGNPERYELA